MPKLTMVEAINLALHQEMAKDDRLIVLGEDVGIDGGVFRVTDNLLAKFGADRVVDTPLAEAGIIGMAVGMALVGLRPIAEMQFCGFSYYIIPQLEEHASRFRSRTHGQRTCPLVIRIPYGGGVRALEHHSESREAMFALIPGVKVAIPSGPRTARALLLGAIRDPDPVIFMEPKVSYRAFREEVPENEELIELGTAQLVSEGSDLTIISWGSMLPRSRKAVEAVQKRRGCSVDLIDLLSIKPMDTEMITRSIKKTGRCLIVQESQLSFSVGSELIARIHDHAFYFLEAPIRRISGYDVVTPYFGREQLYIPSQSRIERGLEELLDQPL